MSVARRSFAVGGFSLAFTVLIAMLPAFGELPPGHEVNERQSCLGCHDLEDALRARVQHAPVTAGECSACHNPHVARFAKLLQESPGPLCQSCHGDLGLEQSNKTVHSPVARGECFACHEPHGSANAGLLVEPGQALCATCHENIADWRTRPVKHSPFARGQCQSCHEPHASENPGLLKGSGTRICLGCHSADASFRANHNGYPVEQAPCQQCHDPHSSARQGLFRETVHQPFSGGDCSSCHTGPGTEEPFDLAKPENELCGDCHEDQVVASREAAFPHVPAGGGNCTACHNPHAGEGSAMLRQDLQSVCLSCHDPGGSKSDLDGRYRTHAEGMEEGDLGCTSCHEPHGGERPLLFAQESVELCGACHSHEHGIRHPLGEETRDPRTGGAMTCRSCHGIHQASYEMYLHASMERELCTGCHKDIGGGL